MSNDFSGKNLSGYSFQGQNLSQANFSRCNLRGTNFSNATLTGANFSYAETGIQWGSVIGLSAVAFLIVFLAVFVGIALPNLTVGITTEIGVISQQFFLITILLFFGLFLFVSYWKSIRLAFIAVTVAIPLAVVVIVAIAIVSAFLAVGGLSTQLSNATLQLIYGIVLGVIAAPITLLIAAFLSIAIAITASFSRKIAISLIVISALMILGNTPGTIAMSLALSKNGIDSLDNVLVVVEIQNQLASGAIDSLEAWSQIFALAGNNLIAGIIRAILLISLPCLAIATYLAWQTLAGNSNYQSLRKIVLSFTTIGGTNFHSADLTDANFSHASLKHSKLKTAILTRTNWFKVKHINLANVGSTYLSDSILQQLVITKQGQNQNFDRKNLSGLNLEEANLENGSFIDVNLSQTTLKSANLARSILVNTQLNFTNLTNATLTGACIDSWGVTHNTQLKNIRCDYIYLQFVDHDKRERLPKQGNFSEGEFTKFVHEIISSFNLYHQDNVNAIATIQVLQNLSQEYDETLEIIGIEKTTNGIVIKVKGSEKLNPDKVSKDYSQRYSQSPDSISQDTQALANQLAEAIHTLSNRPIHHIEYLYNNQIMLTGGSVTPNLNLQINSLENLELTAKQLTIKLNEISNLNPFIRNWLFQLAQIIEIQSNLSLEDQKEALEQLIVIAENSFPKTVKTALRILSGIISNSPASETWVIEYKQLISNLYQHFTDS